MVKLVHISVLHNVIPSTHILILKHLAVLKVSEPVVGVVALRLKVSGGVLEIERGSHLVSFIIGV